MKAFTLASTVLASLPFVACAATQAEKATAVRNAVTHAAQIAALEDGDFVFNFNDAKPVQGDGGKTISANVGNFAALVGQGIALTVGYMEGCGINSPHTHPRATEVLLVLNGTLQAGFFTENNSRYVMNEVKALEAVVLPQGSIHFQANLNCDPLQFVAALSSEDPGTLQVAQGFFKLDSSIVDATLGGGFGKQKVEALAGSLPQNLLDGTAECLARCFPTKQPTTPPTTPPDSSTSNLTMHQIEVGLDGKFAYSTDHIEAMVGDTVRITFHSKNHTLTRSSFDDPCMALTGPDAFDTGFKPVPVGSTAPPPYVDLVIKDDKPFWFYCQQSTHCKEQGMNGGINVPLTGEKSLTNFHAKAKGLA